MHVRWGSAEPPVLPTCQDLAGADGNLPLSPARFRGAYAHRELVTARRDLDHDVIPPGPRPVVEIDQGWRTSGNGARFPARRPRRRRPSVGDAQDRLTVAEIALVSCPPALSRSWSTPPIRLDLHPVDGEALPRRRRAPLRISTARRCAASGALLSESLAIPLPRAAALRSRSGARSTPQAGQEKPHAPRLCRRAP